MQCRVDRALRQIEFAPAAAPQLLGHPIAVQRAGAQDRQQHPIDMPLDFAERHTSTGYA